MTMNSEKPKPTAKTNNWWPAVSTREQAKAATKGGVIVCGVIVVFTGALALYSLFGKSILGITPLSFIDVVLFAAIGFGIWKLSRVAAVAGLVFYLIVQGYNWVTVGPKSPILAILFTLYLVNAVRGTFAYHSLPEPEADREGPWRSPARTPGPRTGDATKPDSRSQIMSENFSEDTPSTMEPTDIYDVQTRAEGPQGELPLTPEMLLTRPSGMCSG
jgi:hypothetical protein